MVICRHHCSQKYHFGYADDLSLLCPSLEGLKEMLFLCEQYAIDYKIMFSSKQGWGQVQYLYLVLVLKYIFIIT